MPYRDWGNATAGGGSQALARAPTIGFSPEIMEDYARQQGGPDALMREVLSARYGEAGADPRLAELSPEDRAALDRYANFAQLREQSSNPVTAAANYLGGMGSMLATEAAKAIPGANRVLSDVYRRVTGADEDEADFFGGADVSRPSLGNITAAHYGFFRNAPAGSAAEALARSAAR